VWKRLKLITEYLHHFLQIIELILEFGILSHRMVVKYNCYVCPSIWAEAEEAVDNLTPPTNEVKRWSLARSVHCVANETPHCHAVCTATILGARMSAHALKIAHWHIWVTHKKTAAGMVSFTYSFMNWDSQLNTERGVRILSSLIRTRCSSPNPPFEMQKMYLFNIRVVYYIHVYSIYVSLYFCDRAARCGGMCDATTAASRFNLSASAAPFQIPCERLKHVVTHSPNSTLVYAINLERQG
jgi:hypothetical protein